MLEKEDSKEKKREVEGREKLQKPLPSWVWSGGKKRETGKREAGRKAVREKMCVAGQGADASRKEEVGGTSPKRSRDKWGHKVEEPIGCGWEEHIEMLFGRQDLVWWQRKFRTGDKGTKWKADAIHSGGWWGRGPEHQARSSDGPAHCTQQCPSTKNCSAV